MAEIEHDTGFLSIGEVLDLLVEEFPDVTISKIRFLESQGLISPQRTGSGYRKFYSEDVDLLRVILTEQRQNFLPLKVIRDRLETGEIDPTGEHLRPAGDDAADRDPASPSPADRGALAGPATRPGSDAADVRSSKSDRTPPDARHAATADAADGPALMPGVRVERDEFCTLARLSKEELDELESFGVIEPDEHHGGPATYDAHDVAIARPAGEFLRLGVDARHLRTFHTAAEREASLFEQLVVPRLRQRNPQARRDALGRLQHLNRLSGELRSAFMRQLLAPQFEN